MHDFGYAYPSANGEASREWLLPDKHAIDSPIELPKEAQKEVFAMNRARNRNSRAEF
jgi:hypothetical protein